MSESLKRSVGKLGDPRISEMRQVVIHYRNLRPSTYLIHQCEVERFVEASKQLHSDPGLNPHNGNLCAKVWKITVTPVRATGPFWWTTPGLQNNDDPRGAHVFNGDYGPHHIAFLAEQERDSQTNGSLGAVTPLCTRPDGHLFEPSAHACTWCGAPRGLRVALPRSGNVVVTPTGEYLVRSMTTHPHPGSDGKIQSIDVNYSIEPVGKANSPRGEEPRAAPTSTPAAGSEQHEVGTAGESPVDPFNCPTCGAHDYGLHAAAFGGCPHCMKAQLDRLRSQVQEWACEKCNAVYPGPPQSGFACVICPKCRGTTMPRAVLEIRRLEAEVARKQAKIDALMLEHCPDDMTPEQTAECARSQQPVRRSSVHDGDRPRPVSREEELFAIWHRAKTATGLDLERLAVKVHLLRVLCPAEPDESLRKRIQCAVSLALGVRPSILERGEGEAQRLRAALTATRGQWIHSVNAAQCFEALGEQASADTHAEDLEFDKALEDALEDFDFAPEPLEVYHSNSWRRVGLKRRYQEVMIPCKQRDGHPDISRPKVLRALVAAFNAMLARRPTP